MINAKEKIGLGDCSNLAAFCINNCEVCHLQSIQRSRRETVMSELEKDVKPRYRHWVSKKKSTEATHTSFACASFALKQAHL
jgi:hypothetical protein